MQVLHVIELIRQHSVRYIIDIVFLYGFTEIVCKKTAVIVVASHFNHLCIYQYVKNIIYISTGNTSI